MRASMRTSLILAATVLTLAVPSADAVNVTGTWVGTMVCDLVVPENPHIRTTGRDLVADILMLDNYRFLLEFQNGGTQMFGSAVDDGRVQTRGKVAAQYCSGNLAITRFLTADAVVNDVTGGGALNGTLIDLLTADPGYVQTCRIAFRRTSAAAPDLDPTCP